MRQLPESYLQLIRQVDDLIAGLLEHPDEAVRARTEVLLAGLDAIHREALWRLVNGLRDAGAGEVLDVVAADPVVEVLLGLYDLKALDGAPPEPTERLVQIGRRPKPGDAG